MRKLLTFAALAALLAVAALGWMYSNATAEPSVRRANITLPDWPAEAAPARIVVMADIHVAGPDMPPERLNAIVDQVNRLRPDIVLIAGDFVSDKRTATRTYSAAEAVAPLQRLRPRIANIAVLGNHDHWRNTAEMTRAISAAGIRLLDNEAVNAGPLRIGGVDDAFTGRANIRTAVDAMRAGTGARLILSHSPDVFPAVPGDVSLVVAGHTHCGQIRLPLLGAVSYMSEYGERYACGVAVEGRKRVLTSAGLGTSIVPLRLGAPPELWLLTLSGARSR